MSARNVGIVRSSFGRVGIWGGRRWSSILETMSTAGLREEGAGMSSNCVTKFSSHAVHGLSAVDTTRSVDLQRPALNSALGLRGKLQRLRNETFDRRAAMQVAQMEGIELGKEVFALLPETKSSQTGSFRRADNTVRRRTRSEVYSGLSNVVECPMPLSHLCPVRKARVQAGERGSPPVGNISGGFGPEISAAPNPTNCFNWPRDQVHSNSQAQDQLLDEQR